MGHGHSGARPRVSCSWARAVAGGRGLSVRPQACPPAHTPASGSQIWLTALYLVLVFTVTLSVFPAITAMVTSSTSPGKWSECWEAEEGWAGERRGEQGEGSGDQGEPLSLSQVSSSTPSAASCSSTSWTAWAGA